MKYPRAIIVLALCVLGLTGCQSEDSLTANDSASDSEAPGATDNDVVTVPSSIDNPSVENLTGDDSSTEKLANQTLTASAAPPVASPGKPGAPVDIRYEVIGKPIVGHPVSINVVITSALSPLDVHYSISDTSALVFQSEQVERLQIADASAGSVQQLTVVPQREGRLYVNVSAEVAADMGTMIRSMAIPIKVGAAPKETAVNGELKLGPDGEAIISLPAQR